MAYTWLGKPYTKGATFTARSATFRANQTNARSGWDPYTWLGYPYSQLPKSLSMSPYFPNGILLFSNYDHNLIRVQGWSLSTASLVILLDSFVNVTFM